MVTITKKELTIIIKDVLTKLEKASVLWFDFYAENKNNRYNMIAYGGLTLSTEVRFFDLGEPIHKWDCGTTCCRLGDLPRAFPIKKEHFNEDGEFSYFLFGRDLFSPVFILDGKALVVISDLSIDKIAILQNFIKTNCYKKSEFNLAQKGNVLYFEFLWDLLFNSNLKGTKLELIKNYPKVTSMLNFILELIE